MARLGFFERVERNLRKGTNVRGRQAARRRPRVRLAVVFAVVTLAAGGSLGYALTRDDQLDLATVSCVPSDDPRSEAAREVDLDGESPLEVCARVLHGQGSGGRLVACVDADAYLTVVRLTGTAGCDEVALQDPPVGYERAIREWRRFVGELRGRLGNCADPRDAAAFAEREMRERGLGRWSVTAAFQGGCAEGFLIDFRARSMTIG